MCWKVKPKGLAQLVLAHAEQRPAQTDTAADVHINRMARHDVLPVSPAVS
jgi:hypothetical protein